MSYPYWEKKIPEKRLVTIHSSTNQAELKIKIRNDGMWNAGLALATSDKELKLIQVRQADYPVHLIEEILNPIIIHFYNGGPILIPGSMKGSFRPSFIGPRYSKVFSWVPLSVSGADEASSIPDIYQLLSDIQNKTSNRFYGSAQISMADDLIQRKAVVC